MMKQTAISLFRTTAIAALCAVGLALAFATPAFADTAADKQAEAATALASLNTMQASLDAASNNYTQALMDQQSAEQAKNDAQSKIDEESEKISGYQSRLGTRAKSMYRTGSNTFFDVLLGSTSFESFTTNWDILNQLNDDDAELVNETKDSREQLENAKQQYETQEQLATAKANEAKQIKDEAESTVSSMQAVYDGLSAEAAALLEEERAAQAAAQAAQAQATVNASAAAGTAAGNTANTGGGNDSGYDSSYDSGSDSGSSSSSGGSYGGGGSVVERAYNCLGAPYAWGACGPSSFDCSGLVSYCLTGSYSRLGTTDTFLGWQQVSDPQPGDVCVNSSHCGIYIGGGQMIHASDYGTGVIVGAVQSGMIIVRY